MASSGTMKYASSHILFEKILKSYEEDTMTNFVVLTKDKAFGQEDPTPGQKKIMWELKHVPFNGLPFMVVGRKVYSCHQGYDKHRKYKQTKRKQQLDDHSDHSFKESRRILQDTKKLDCPARIYVVHIIRFPGYKIPAEVAKQKMESAKRLKFQLAINSSAVTFEQQYVLCLPDLGEHRNHPVVGEAAQVREAVDPRVVAHIEKLAMAGARQVREVRRHLNAFVSDLFKGEALPPPTRRRFYPIDKDIYNVLSAVKNSKRQSSIDQVNLQGLVDDWRTRLDCHIKYRPSQEEEDGGSSKLLFCLQTPWQRRLLTRYGQQMCLLDATYRTCRYSVPLFFLCVRTNVHYAVVGVFVNQTETAVDIREALAVYQEWNPEWQPSHFMVDFCEAEINALEAEFPESKVLLCDFHREKAWVEWTRRKENGCGEDVLPLLRAIADSPTAGEYQYRLCQLQQSTAWLGNEKLRRWFSNKWLPQAKRWVQVFKGETLRVAIYTNNGVERQNESLKLGHLVGYKNCSLSELLTVVVTDFLPMTYQRYIRLNVKSSGGYRQYSDQLPLFLRDKPRAVVEHVLERHLQAMSYRQEHVTEQGEGVFSVQSQTTEGKHLVEFGSPSTMPYCSCRDWQRNLLPCKHFCVVFRIVQGWGWEKLADTYRDNPLFSLDEVYLSSPLPPGDTTSTSLVEPTTPPRDTTSTSPPRDTTSTSPPRDTTSTSPPRDTTFTSLVELTTPPRDALPANPHPGNKITKRQKCGSLLREISDYTYHLQDLPFLDSVITRLTDLLEDVRLHTPHDETLPLSYTPPSKKTKHTPTSMMARPVKPLSMVPQKHRFSGRVGRHAEVMKSCFKPPTGFQPQPQPQPPPGNQPQPRPPPGNQPQPRPPPGNQPQPRPPPGNQPQPRPPPGNQPQPRPPPGNQPT